jgi:hypothetical protein
MNQSEFTPNQYNMLQPRQVSTSWQIYVHVIYYHH